MFEIKDFTPRLYQREILKTAIENNTLVVLPTGLGKTAISILLAVERLNKFPDSKILLLSPTKPLCNQHVQSFKKYTNINQEEILLFTGATKAKDREKLWTSARVIVATPQTIKSDLINNRISLKDISMLCIDEAHHSRMYYANTFVTKLYKESAIAPKILALTASPGSTKEKINEICNNLNIEKVEIRTEEDDDVKPYIQEKEIEWINVILPQSFVEIKNLIRSVYKDKIKKIKELGIPKPLNAINKRDLLKLQVTLQKQLSKGNNIAYYGLSLVAQAIKIEHSLTLLETQGLEAVKIYLEKLKSEKTKAAKIITSNKNIMQADNLIKNLVEKNIKHPKIEKLSEIIKEELKQNPNSRIIVFANFRFTVNELLSTLSKIPEAKPIRLIGQKEGLTQKQQIQIIKDFANGIYNVIIGTSISEEGLDIVEANLAIFYEPIPSEIRSIQRKGRVGRMNIGKIIILITKGTKDEAYYWSSFQKEKKMKKILYNMQKKSEEQKK